MSVKALVKNALRGRKISRPPLIPFIGSYLTKVDSVSIEEMLNDPGILHQALRNTQQLLHYDAVVMPVDTTLEVEALGASISWSNSIPILAESLSLKEAPTFEEETWNRRGRLPVFIEAASRFAQIEGKTIPLFAVVTGPLTIWSKLYGQTLVDIPNHEVMKLPHLETIVQSIISLCKHYAEAGVDGIIINEGNIQYPIDEAQSVTGIYKPIVNVIHYFNLLSILLNPQKSEHYLFTSVNANAGVLYSDQPMNQENKKGSIGIPLKKDFWSEEIDDSPLIKRFVSDCKNKGLFLTTDRPMNEEDIHLLDLQTKIEIITNDSYWKL